MDFNAFDLQTDARLKYMEGAFLLSPHPVRPSGRVFFEKTHLIMAKQGNKKRSPRKKETDPPDDGNQYDKLLKESFRNSAIDLLTLFLGMSPGKYSAAHVEYQKTRERRTDFTFEFEAMGEPKRIVHFEVHGKNDKKLVHRQFDTAGLINWHYPSPVWDLVQVVLFIGRRNPTMPTELKKSDIGYRFRLFWVKDFKYQDFLKTGNPDMFLLAAIADYGEKSAKEVFIEVVNKAKAVFKDSPDFDIFVEKLHVLTNAHKLQHIFNQVYMQLSQLIDEKNDPFFLRGKLEGEILGEIRGMSEKTLDFASRLILQFDHSDKTIAGLLDLQEKTVAEIRKIIQEHPADYRGRLKNIDLHLQIKPRNGTLNGH